MKNGVFINQMKYFILLLAGCISCVNEIRQGQEFKIEYLNSDCPSIHLPTPQQLEANFRVFYYGPKTNLIKVNLQKSYTQIEMYSHFNDVLQIKDANIEKLIGEHPLEAKQEYAKILIDTTTVIQTNYLTNEKKQGIGKEDKCVSHYPVIIENTHRSFFNIGYGNNVKLIIEAKNQKGDWIPITHPPILFCGTGLKSVPLSAGEIVITAIPITEGNIKTNGRIKLGDVISNEIYISIDSAVLNSGP